MSHSGFIMYCRKPGRERQLQAGTHIKEVATGRKLEQGKGSLSKPRMGSALQGEVSARSGQVGVLVCHSQGFLKEAGI